jgi:DNA replication protein DnaC
VNAEILSLAKQFHLIALKDGKVPDPSGMDAETYLLEVLRAEQTARLERAAQTRLKRAQFPTYKSFEEFDTDFQKGVTRKQLDMLAELDWIDSLFNLILIGPPGTGKTHIALAVGNKAVRNGYHVAFHTMNALVHILKTQDISRKSLERLRWIKRCQLVIIDEMGYLPVSRTEANAFFALISELYDSASVVITSNKGFDGWAEILGDPVLATALLDRLTHRCQILNFTDDSYRLAHRQQIFTS